MRRTDREILDLDRMEEIMKACQICRVGFANGNIPYIVPMNFGGERAGDAFTFYFHAAKEGRKIDCMRDNPNVAFEMDTGYELMLAQNTAHYESLMGYGLLTEVFGDEARYGLRCLLRHCGGDEAMPISDEALSRVAVLKLEVREMTAKANK